MNRPAKELALALRQEADRLQREYRDDFVQAMLREAATSLEDDCDAEERLAWDAYASSGVGVGPMQTFSFQSPEDYADHMLAERRKRFGAAS